MHTKELVRKQNNSSELHSRRQTHLKDQIYQMNTRRLARLNLFFYTSVRDIETLIQFIRLILQLFKAYPNSVQEIEDMIHSEKAKADCNYQTNPQVIIIKCFLLVLRYGG